MSKSDLNVRERFRAAVREYGSIENSTARQDSPGFQKDVSSVLREFSIIQMISDRISLFSANEPLDEINTQYLPFAAIEFYRATLLQKSLTNSRGEYIDEEESKHMFKTQNLDRAKVSYIAYLHQIDSFGGILEKEQHSRIEAFKSYNPSNEELLAEQRDPAAKRASKIANFRSEKELREKISLLDGYFLKSDADSSEKDNSYDEDIVRQMFIDQMKLFALRSFAGLESIAMESQVLQQRIPFLEKARLREIDDKRIRDDTDFTEYTSRLERVPRKEAQISDLLDKQGKILQPFVITSNKQDLKRKVFGTGQVLPSMSIEEYLDYEVANGKMASAGDPDLCSDEDDDSDEELRKREWDDWRDDNPKGSGNMKANVG